jgi:hypothetical protein
MVQISRRRLLQTGTTTVATAGIAGCLGQGGASLDSVTVAYVPIYPNMQHYVMEQEGFYENVPADVSIERFSSGPSVVKAFASVDARTRDRLHAELLDIWAQTEQTVVFVTHDIDEAVTLADRVIVMGTDSGTVQSTISIDLARPRERTDHDFVEYVARIRNELGSPGATSA